MSIRPKYGKRSVLQVLSDGMSQHPPTGKSCCEDAALNAAEVDRLTRERDEIKKRLAARTGEVAYWMDLFRERGEQIESLQEPAEQHPTLDREAVRAAHKKWMDEPSTGSIEGDNERLIDIMTALVPAAEQRPTLNREAVRKVLEPVLYDVTMSAAVTNAILALAPAVPSWLGDVPSKPKVKRVHSGEWQAGSGLYQGSVTSRECRKEAWELIALADAIDAEEAKRNDDVQRIEEQQ